MKMSRKLGSTFAAAALSLALIGTMSTPAQAASSDCPNSPGVWICAWNSQSLSGLPFVTVIGSGQPVFNQWVNITDNIMSSGFSRTPPGSANRKWCGINQTSILGGTAVASFPYNVGVNLTGSANNVIDDLAFRC
jgi:hypothetical protein